MAHRENKKLRLGEKEEEVKFSDERNENLDGFEINSKEPAFFDYRSEYEFHEVKGPYFSTYDCPEYLQRLNKYREEGEGFDIQHFARLPGCVRPVSRADKIMFKHCIDGVITVLDYLKKRGDELKLQFLRLIKANFRSDYLYFVTFEAKNEDSGEIKFYQSVIYHDDPYTSSKTERQTAIYMLRVKQGKVVLPVEDLRNEYESGIAKTIEIKGFHIVNKPGLIEDCEMALKEVLEYLSSKDEIELKLVKITMAKYEEQHDDDFDETNCTFFITFEATNKDSELETYQSVISLDVEAPTRLHMFGKEK